MADSLPGVVIEEIDEDANNAVPENNVQDGNINEGDYKAMNGGGSEVDVRGNEVEGDVGGNEANERANEFEHAEQGEFVNEHGVNENKEQGENSHVSPGVNDNVAQN
ncbi:hypothetical protein GH714_001837 [Hevea brasiliensis]|uniref:Uncharacterized protein n=1 Tax=Hevea brasiliensis TaxID=3981 RepID=A0A6A6NFF8_HEVBR|nr:hypothetical protein GH714_001837 [Hevea brasiliensis]